MLAKKLGEQWKQTAVVDNRAGGAGVIGTDLVAKATPNGYTLLVSAPGPITTGTLLQEKLPYDPVKDLTPITLLAFTPSVLLVGPTVPSRTVAELIALAKSKPGKLNYASSGRGIPAICMARCSPNSPASISCIFRTRAAVSRWPICLAGMSRYFLIRSLRCCH